jgi:hypothetical protein
MRFAVLALAGALGALGQMAAPPSSSSTVGSAAAAAQPQCAPAPLATRTCTHVRTMHAAARGAGACSEADERVCCIHALQQ